MQVRNCGFQDFTTQRGQQKQGCSPELYHNDTRINDSFIYGLLTQNNMTQQDEEQLKLEIDHIFDSGANELRVFEMVKNFIDSRKTINKNFVLADVSLAHTLTRQFI